MGNAKQHPKRQTHPIAPVYDARSEVLILGSFPSPASREVGFFYGHPQNRMWRVLARIFDEPVPATIERKHDFLLRHHIAMWDVLASCTIAGASDASIADEVPNDLQPLLDAAPISQVYCAGQAAARLYAKHLQSQTGIECVAMPSTSPANAAWSLDALVDAWSIVATCVHRNAAPVLDVADVVALERSIDASGTTLAELMDRAGTWLAYRVNAHAQRMQGTCRIVVLAGNGNNGGDGWVAARELAGMGHDVVLVSVRAAEEIEAQPARDAAVAACGQFDRLGIRLMVDPSSGELSGALDAADIIVDAILGTGFAHDSVRAPFDEWIRLANARRSQGALIVAADCPSGLNAQTGRAASVCIQADETVTMIVSKTGLHRLDGPDACGAVCVAALCDLAGFLEEDAPR